MPTISTSKIPGCPQEWADQHPTITMFVDRPHGIPPWALYVSCMGKVILEDIEGDDCTTYTRIPPAVIHTVYAWLNAITPILGSHECVLEDEYLEWVTDDDILVVANHEGPLTVSLYQDDSRLAHTTIGSGGMHNTNCPKTLKSTLTECANLAHKYFNPLKAS